MSSALCLTGYGVVLAITAPRWLSHAISRGRAPRLEIGAWLLALATTTSSLLLATISVARDGNPWLATIGWVLLAAGVARVLWAGEVTRRESRSRRRSHSQLVAILGRPDPRLGAVIVDAGEPLVYCLRTPAPTVVVTTAARQALTPSQLSAALAHERAHLTGRHHLLLAIVYSAARAVPWLALFTQAALTVGELLEMRADDAAARRYGRRTVATAIAAMSRRPAPVGALGAAGPSALARGLRLCSTEPTWRTRSDRLLVAATVLALAAGPYLAATLPLCPHNLW